MEKTKINWKVRFKNKVWLTAFISLIIGFIYNILKLFDVYPTVTQSMVMEIVGQFLTFLGLFGVIIDPTTAGIGDSERALGYEKPWDDNAQDEESEPDEEKPEDEAGPTE